MSVELQNRELLDLLIATTECEITCENAISRLQLHFEFGEDYESAVHFCSSHFFELDWSSVTGFPIELAIAIVSQESLKLRDEDQLLHFIRSGLCKDERYCNLFEFVRFEYLSVSSMEWFVNCIMESFDLLTPSVWSGLCRRLTFPVSPSSSSERDRFISQFIQCGFVKDSPLNGIIAFLTKKYGGHVQDRGIVLITASSAGTQARMLADFQGNQNYFCTQDIPGSWICYEFKSRCIRATHYTVRSSLAYDSWHLRSWVLEGSMDGSSWIELDSREGNEDLRGKSATATFGVSRSEKVRMIRLRQLGKNSSATNELVLNAFEVFGDLRELLD
jgi:hypothetical protein